MPRVVRTAQNCAEHSDGCNCVKVTTGTEQGFEELDFARSACAAAQSGNVEKLRSILERRPEQLHQDGKGGSSGYTPLHYASRAGKLEAVAHLLQRGANVDAALRASAATPLHRAAFGGHLDVVKLLIAAGADRDAQDADGETALHKAAAQGHAATVEFLLRECAASASATDRHGRSAAQRAAPTVAHLFGLGPSH